MTRVVVIGAGISGLATAYAIEQLAVSRELELDVVVLERRERSGGKILSLKEEGYLCEWGPNGFLDSKPSTLELCDRLAIRDQLLRSNDNARKRFIYAGGQLHRLPENGLSFLKSGLISWPGKMRLAMEPFIPKRVDGVDETLAEFARRRLGSEALDKLIGPMVSGIFAGDPETMSLKSCFSRIHELEQQYGGLIKAMVKLAKKKRAEVKAGKAVASAAGPGGVLTSFDSGIQGLTDAVAGGLKGAVKLASGVRSISKNDAGYRLQLEDGSEFEADLVVSAAPAHALSEMLATQSPKVADLLRQILYAPMNVVCFGYQRDKIAHDLMGFGYLNAKRERRPTLGTLWDSSIFPHRAPEGHVLLRSMMGGATNTSAIDLSDEEVKEKVMGDLKQIMGIAAEPDMVRIYRHERAIPQYTVGHAARVAAIEEQLQTLPGLFATGNAFAGVGINDCTLAAQRTAEQLVEYCAKR